ncbi:hypothetical protein Ait01nite_000640 [Actinoplanes italicus]|uniref:hypothetical protein n=1 Tax=Actinoplanes italicus TaxID=113567 RepID=UPI0019434CC2|nr:hypothetical protein [Actinoplanes italicus]GIE27019.1 hypothetical protein Ait01nite_000640 [Actinoplanes italicus]
MTELFAAGRTALHGRRTGPPRITCSDLTARTASDAGTRAKAAIVRAAELRCGEAPVEGEAETDGEADEAARDEAGVGAGVGAVEEATDEGEAGVGAVEEATGEARTGADEEATDEAEAKVGAEEEATDEAGIGAEAEAEEDEKATDEAEVKVGEGARADAEADDRGPAAGRSVTGGGPSVLARLAAGSSGDEADEHPASRFRRSFSPCRLRSPQKRRRSCSRRNSSRLAE